jgi:hypothetical protein
MPKKIDPKVKERCVRLVLDHLQEYPTLTAAATAVTVSPSAITARTASYRCSATDISLMNQGVSPINRSRRNPSAETPSPITRRPNE